MCRFQTVVQAYLSSSASLCVAEIRKPLFLHNFRCKLMCRPTATGATPGTPNTGIVRCVPALATPPLAPDLSRQGKQNAFQPAFCAVHRICVQ